MKEILLLGIFWLLTNGLKEDPYFPVYGEVSRKIWKSKLNPSGSVRFSLSHLFNCSKLSLWNKI